MSSEIVSIRLAGHTIQTLDILVKNKVFRSRNRAIEQFIFEGLEKRKLINYAVLAEETPNVVQD